MTPSYQRTGFTLKQTTSIAFFFFHNGSFFGQFAFGIFIFSNSLSSSYWIIHVDDKIVNFPTYFLHALSMLHCRHPLAPLHLQKKKEMTALLLLAAFELLPLYKQLPKTSDRNSPKETALCHCSMVRRGLYIYRENIRVMSVNALVRNPPLLFYKWPKLRTRFESVTWWDWTSRMAVTSSQ